MKPIASLISSVIFISSIQSSIAEHHTQSTYKVSNLSENLLLLQGRGGNIALSRGQDGILIIDNDYDDLGEALKQQIEALADGEALKFILNTHWHGYHTGNNENLNHGSVNIVAHDNVRKRLSTRQEIPAFNRVIEAQSAAALPTITFPDAMTLHFNNETLTLQHYANGHTDGDSVIFFERHNAVHMGDHMFYPVFPFVDIASGGNAIAYAKNVGEVIAAIDDNTRVIPGHGPLTDKQRLMDFHSMLTATLAEDRSMKTQGMTLAQAQPKGLTAQWESPNEGFIKEPVWISFIYASLK
jgi:glyoxylase-like metal-dependent hydrolase (beta-lactamase superfamily II)